VKTARFARPASQAPPLGDVSEARTTTRRVARTFALACRLLPRPLRDDVYLLYLVFRTLDDLVDEGLPEAAQRVAGVRAWAEGGPAVTREATILDALAARRSIPRDAIADFCAGMEHDLSGAAVTTEAELDTYCYRVAGTVGVVMTGILGTTDTVQGRETAAALGMAMQRTNILRDIDEDDAAGRIYLAADTVARFGGSLAPGDRAALMHDQIARADALYDRGIDGLELLVHGRRAVAAAAAMYREILRQIEREGYGARPGRAIVPQRRKLAIAARSGVLVR
jgi:15-cis-phytoene synthase